MTATRSLKHLAILTASWPVRASATSKVSCGLASALTCGDFGHQRFIDMLAAGGIEDDHVVAADPGRRHGALGDVERALAGDDRQAWRRPPARPAHCNCSMAAGRLTSSDAISTRFFSLFCSSRASLADGGGLARALQADHQDRRGRRAERERGIFLAQGLDQRVMDDLDDLLAGRDRADDIFADGARARPWR